jgi:FtsH-binding integral membrane protein
MHKQKVSQEVMSDQEIVYRIGEIERISAILTTLDSLSFDETSGRRIAILGSLMLYLDFINLFLFMLRIFGRRD